jgi:hypothetical protein
MLAIADLAGGEWLDRARQAAVSIARVGTDMSIGTKLLADINDIFAIRAVDRLPFLDLVEALGEIEGDPLSWTPEHLCLRSPRWRKKRRDHPGPRRAHRRCWRRSLNRRRNGDACRRGSGLTTAEREELTHWQRAADRTRTQVGRYVVVVAAQPCWRFAARNAATARLMTSLSYVLARARRSPARLSCILSVTVIEFSETGAAGLPARAGSR